MSRSIRRAMIDRGSCRGCVNVSCWTSAGPRCTTGRYRPEDLELMALMDRQYEDPLLRLQEDEGLAAARAIW